MRDKILISLFSTRNEKKKDKYRNVAELDSDDDTYASRNAVVCSIYT